MIRRACFLLLFVATELYATGITGVVLDEQGKPLDKVLVQSDIDRCCDARYTNSDGRFEIVPPKGYLPSAKAEVIHFYKDGYLPLTISPTSLAINVKLMAGNDALEVPICRNLSKSALKVPWFPYIFKIPPHAPKKTMFDVDYGITSIGSAYKDQWLRIWYGPYAGNENPGPAKLIRETAEIKKRTIRIGKDGKGRVGFDTKGITKDGKRWRHFGVPPFQAEYEGVIPEVAAYFDQIIDSACFSDERPAVTRH